MSHEAESKVSVSDVASDDEVVSSLCSEIDSNALSDDGDYLLDIASCLRTDDGESIATVLASLVQKVDVLNKLFYKLISNVSKK